MNRHPFRWEPLAFGALFLAVAVNWAVWEGELLDSSQLTYLLAGVLIAGGLIGVVATVGGLRRRPTPEVTTPTENENEEEIHEQAADPKP